ncbi:glycosyltransferase, partial [Mesomycoplasma ovipneumoniae]|uniref:glycosyltransferase family 2 protein n=1 Tax=Mesomycoplasma ovipneumoniae TaxID=29562 RepID=UPI00311925AA
MKVSVLLPIYGVENYIAHCATSLMEQTYKDVEYIFVNDGTPDASIERLNQVIERYPDRRVQVQVIAHEQNMGLAMARATALCS